MEKPPFSSGINEPQGPGIDWSEAVRDFLNFVGPGSVRFKIGPMPVGSSPWILGPEFSLIKLKKDR